MARIYENVSDLVGNTPLVKLNRIAEGVEATVVAKLEFYNPANSVKDRIGVSMVDALEASGALKPGGTLGIVDRTAEIGRDGTVRAAPDGLLSEIFAMKEGEIRIFEEGDFVALVRLDAVAPAAQSGEGADAMKAATDRGNAAIKEATGG